MGFGSFLKKALKVVAIVAAVVAVAYFAAPLLGELGTAITTGVDSLISGVSAGFTELGTALGITAEAPIVEGAAAAQALTGEAAAFAGGEAATAAATTAAKVAPAAADVAAMADVGMGAAEAGQAAAGQVATQAAASAPVADTFAAATQAAPAAAQGAAQTAAGTVGGAAQAASTVAPSLTVAPTAGDVALMGDVGMGAAKTAEPGLLQQVMGFAKENPLLAAAAVKGVGGAAQGYLASQAEENKIAAQQKAAEEERAFVSSSIPSSDQVSRLKRPTGPLRRPDGSLVWGPNGMLVTANPALRTTTTGG